MKLHQYNYSSEQCERQWKTLVRSIKKGTDHYSKSANDLKTYPHEEQLEFVIEWLNIKPPYILGSTIDSGIQADEGLENMTAESIRSTSPAPPVPAHAKKKRSNVSEVLYVLKELICVQNTRQED